MLSSIASRSGVPSVLSAEQVQTVAGTISCGIAAYNVIELNFLIWSTFKRRAGLYFWSFLIATNGILPYATGYLLLYYTVAASPYIMVTLTTIGSTCMISGQAMVLYSRLHLINQNQTVLRLILALIIIAGVLTHIPIAVFQYGTSARPSNPDTWFAVFLIWRKIEISLLCFEETVISALYIYAAVQFFRLKKSMHGQAERRLAMPLLVVNSVVIFLDLTLLVATYTTLSTFQPGYRALVYSVKLKIELNLLNSLAEITKQPDHFSLRKISTIENSGN